MDSTITETDPRFPSGRWVGFYVHHGHAQQFPTELQLQFVSGVMTGSGSDKVGHFDLSGSYELGSGKCNWLKQYVGKHAVNYNGFNEGKGIWGTWTITIAGEECRGGFHIWPVDSGSGSDTSLKEEKDIPWEKEEVRGDPMGDPVLV